MRGSVNGSRFKFRQAGEIVAFAARVERQHPGTDAPSVRERETERIVEQVIRIMKNMMNQAFRKVVSELI
jgi:hypothetical protein